MEEEKAKAGRLNTHLSYKTVNDEGVATIEVPAIIVRDQSQAQASLMLIKTLEGASFAAQSQVTNE